MSDLWEAFALRYAMDRSRRASQCFLGGAGGDAAMPVAYHAFILKGEGLFNPMLLIIVALAVYLLWVGRKAFAGLLN